MYINWRELREGLAVILTLTALGVLLTATATTAGMHYVLQWGWPAAAVFGILVAATDTVSVIATFKEAGVLTRVRRLFLNPRACSTMVSRPCALSAAIVWIMGEKVTAFDIGRMLIASIFGGIFCGASHYLGDPDDRGRTTDHLTEITLTTVAAYGSFLLADRLQLSGVLASLTAGLILGNTGFLRSIL